MTRYLHVQHDHRQTKKYVRSLWRKSNNHSIYQMKQIMYTNIKKRRLKSSLSFVGRIIVTAVMNSAFTPTNRITFITDKAEEKFTNFR